MSSALTRPKALALSIVLMPLMVALSLPMDCRADNVDVDSQLKMIMDQIESSPPTDQIYAQLQKIVKEDPSNYKARLVLGDCFEKSGLFENALEQYKQAMKNAPDAPDAYTKVIEEQLTYGQTDAAAALLKVAATRFPRDPQINYLLGSSLAAQGRYSDAEMAYNYAEKNSTKPIPGLKLGKATLRLPIQKYEEAIELVIQEPPSIRMSPMGQEVLGTACARSGLYKEAYEPLRNAFLKHPFKGDLAPLYAEVCMKNGLYEEASEPALIEMAKQMDDSHNIEQSALVVQSAISKCPRAKVGDDVEKIISHVESYRKKKYPEMRYLMGEILDNMGLHDAANQQYRLSFADTPRDFRPAFRLALNLELYDHKYEESLLYYTKALGISPQTPYIHDFHDRLQLKLLERKQDIAWRIKDFILERLHRWFNWSPPS